ncbi:MAG: hypothetical protein PHC56_07245 [Herbinix sp.]|nr:hypothetical protein [Herbinix sp.]
MSKVWECVIDTFIGVLIMFVSVSVYFGLRTESVIKSMYEGMTEEFVVDVKKNGLLTLDDYENYMERMGTGNSLFNISLEHRYKIYEPEYRFKTLEEILEDQKNAYTGSNDYYYREVKTERPNVEDPINDGNINTETNESVLAKAVNSPADPNHIHDENCYGGHKHIGSKSFTHIHAHKAGECREYISCTIMEVNCNNCGAHYFPAGYYYWDDNSNSKQMSYADFSGTNECKECSSRNVNCTEPMNYYAYSCGYNNSYMYGDPEGVDITIPYNVEYEYERSDPQGRLGGTYTSGCYVYHQTKSVFDNFKYDDFYGHILHGSILSGMYKMMYTDRFNGYCEIPLYYTIGLSDRNTYEYGDGFSGPASYNTIPSLCCLTYKAYKDENGTLRFAFTGYNASGIGGTDNPGFPDNITANQFAAMKESQLNNLFYNVLDINYYEQYQYNNGIVFHANCLNSNIGTEEYIDICGFDHSLGVNRWITTCGYEEDNAIDCNGIIDSLVSTHSEQKVYINDPLITTAIATYRDGSKKTVICSTDFSTSVVENDKSITLEYSYIIDNHTYTKTCTINVTVIPRNKTCTEGHIYNVNNDGSDPGCPYCREWIHSLRVINPTTSPIVITIGTTLQDNNVRLLAAYMDGHTEEVTSGYIDNLDIGYLGTKPVTIGYKGASVTVMVTTVCATMTCDICGYVYNLYSDGTNPGCPRCIQKIPVFTGNIMEYEHINHTEEILDMLYGKKKYIFNVDDSFGVNVSNKSSTIARKLLRKIYPSLSDKWLKIEKMEHIMSK